MKRLLTIGGLVLVAGVITYTLVTAYHDHTTRQHWQAETRTLQAEENRCTDLWLADVWRELADKRYRLEHPGSTRGLEHLESWDGVSPTVVQWQCPPLRENP